MSEDEKPMRVIDDRLYKALMGKIEELEKKYNWTRENQDRLNLHKERIELLEKHWDAWVPEDNLTRDCVEWIQFMVKSGTVDQLVENVEKLKQKIEAHEASDAEEHDDLSNEIAELKTKLANHSCFDFTGNNGDLWCHPTKSEYIDTLTRSLTNREVLQDIGKIIKMILLHIRNDSWGGSVSMASLRESLYNSLKKLEGEKEEYIVEHGYDDQYYDEKPSQPKELGFIRHRFCGDGTPLKKESDDELFQRGKLPEPVGIPIPEAEMSFKDLSQEEKEKRWEELKKREREGYEMIVPIKAEKPIDLKAWVKSLTNDTYILVAKEHLKRWKKSLLEGYSFKELEEILKEMEGYEQK